MRSVESRGDSLARFVSRLLEMPALRQLAALQKEEQALQFLRNSGPQLQAVFASLGLDLSAGWREAAAAVAQAVKAEADRLLRTEFASLIDTRLSLSFFPALAGGVQAPARAREELLALFQRTAGQPVSRSALAGSLAAAKSDLTDKYISQAWERKKYTYVEVTRVQRLSLPPAQLADLVRFSLMVRPAAYLYMTGGAAEEKDTGYSPLQEQYLQKILPALSAALPSFPPSLLQAGLRSALAYPGAGNVEAVARLTAILALRGRTLAPGMVVDRGADSPDMSWFNVNRRNARWHGFDPGMLDELYTIAAENNW
jgi:hypothetical protein